MERLLKYTFTDKGLLTQALTHSSADLPENYERLEFLGDAVLELIVTVFLYEKHPEHNEGELTALRAKIVREEYLTSWARKQNLGEYLIVGKGEENSGGRDKSSILCDVTESVIGAVYLDGGMDAAKGVVDTIINHGSYEQEKDFKTELQNTVQQDKDTKVHYEVYAQEGPPHDATFYVHVFINEEQVASGTGKSKKQAEQEAAKKALASL